MGRNPGQASRVWDLLTPACPEVLGQEVAAGLGSPHNLRQENRGPEYLESLDAHTKCSHWSCCWVPRHPSLQVVGALGDPRVGNYRVGSCHKRGPPLVLHSNTGFPHTSSRGCRSCTHRPLSYPLDLVGSDSRGRGAGGKIHMMLG